MFNNCRGKNNVQHSLQIFTLIEILSLNTCLVMYLRLRILTVKNKELGILLPIFLSSGLSLCFFFITKTY